MKKFKKYAKKAKDWMKKNPKKVMLIAAMAAAFYFGARMF